MGGLRLQQKRNGVELSTELMVASIRLSFKASPERVIEVIRDRLPELLPATADPIQLASSKPIALISSRWEPLLGYQGNSRLASPFNPPECLSLRYS
jgi:hypothetical protein